MSSQLSPSRKTPALAQDAELRASSSQDEANPAPPALTSKEMLSATFTIAAAACGLISDGCECLLAFTYSREYERLPTSPFPDQNNLMTMANVGSLIASASRNYPNSFVLSRSYFRDCIQRITLLRYRLAFRMPFLLVRPELEYQEIIS